MATAAPNLPLFYNAIEPLNLDQHGTAKVRGITSMYQHARSRPDPCGAADGR